METRMEYPLMSYEQELLMTHVPFKNRVAFLSDYVKPDAQHMTVDEIANRLNVSKGRIETLAGNMGANFVHESTKGETYELYTFEVIEEEIIWQKVEASLEEYVSAYVLAEHLAKSEVWVQRTAYSLGIYPEERHEGNRRTIVYPRELLGMLRTVILHTPPANELYSIDETEVLVGKDRQWITRMVSEHELLWETRLLSMARKKGVHYPEETVDALKALASELPPPAGDWLTVSQLGRATGRTKEWIRSHLGSYADVGEFRIADNNKIELHYPVEALEYLKRIIAELPPYAGDWVTVWGIAQKLHRSVPWVQKHIVEFESLAEFRLTNRGNRPLLHYPPEVLEAMTYISENN